ELGGNEYTYSLGSQGWRCSKSSKILEQWGTARYDFVSTAATNFHLRFSGVYSVSTQHLGTADQHYSLPNVTSDGFTTVRHGGAQHQFFWFAIGRGNC
ncbi:TPA: hypothetical protein ACR6K7_006139, partial [Pseudomonas aeruginosa]